LQAGRGIDAVGHGLEMGEGSQPKMQSKYRKNKNGLMGWTSAEDEVHENPLIKAAREHS